MRVPEPIIHMKNFSAILP